MSEHDPETINILNALLKNKLTGINQYFLHARTLKHMGELRLADYVYKASIDAMKHSDMLVEHVLALGGRPNLQELGHLMIGNTPDEMFSNDLRHSEAVVVQLKAAINFCESKKNLRTVGLLSRILEAQLEHADFIHNYFSPVEINAPSIKDYV